MTCHVRLLVLGAFVLLFGCTKAKLYPCAYNDRENGWSEIARCFQEIPDTLGRVDSAVVPRISYEPETELASIHLSDGYAYINKEGAIIIRGVMVMDNGADPFIDGLTRFKRNGKIGFANCQGKVAIPPRFDGALPFAKGYARVCVGCTEERMNEYHYYAGGDWSCLDTEGKIVTPNQCEPSL